MSWILPCKLPWLEYSINGLCPEDTLTILHYVDVNEKLLQTNKISSSKQPGRQIVSSLKEAGRGHRFSLDSLREDSVRDWEVLFEIDGGKGLQTSCQWIIYSYIPKASWHHRTKQDETDQPKRSCFPYQRLKPVGVNYIYCPSVISLQQT